MKFFLLLLVSFGAHAASSFVVGEDLRGAMDAHSRAANLRVLKNSRNDELRVWSHDYMGGRITGFVISESGAMMCHTTYEYANGAVTINRARCRPWHKGQEALVDLGAIAKLDGKQWDCPRLDGGGYYIEGTHGGNRFAFRVGNPDACEDAGSKAVVNLLAKLW